MNEVVRHILLDVRYLLERAASAVREQVKGSRKRTRPFYGRDTAYVNRDGG